MTLSPVFRSPEAIQALREKGHLDALAPSLKAQRASQKRLHELLNDVIEQSRLTPSGFETDDVQFLQEHFFLVLFDSVFRSLDCPPDRRELYGLLNQCVRGVIVASDNLFDDESKMDLPLKLSSGHRFQSIMQLLCFDHLAARVFESCDTSLATEDIVRFRRDLLSTLAHIGALEGSEERGVDTVPDVDRMIETVHRVRGGELFALAFIAPRVWEPASERDRWETARDGIARLGTAFQIVDDLTDFEFDLTRRSHNVLSSHIIHRGSDAERKALDRWRNNEHESGVTVEALFAESARGVLDLATAEAEKGFTELEKVGFWFPPDDCHLFVRAIAGDAGESRMQAVAGLPDQV